MVVILALGIALVFFALILLPLNFYDEQLGRLAGDAPAGGGWDFVQREGKRLGVVLLVAGFLIVSVAVLIS